ncbi:MAG: glycosyltransferase family 39 protein [Coleofasciculus chthonoplastes F3-SA18-01]|uniref:glycosyltransferase family 39 protein n=1 Tax=Coleofasciculus chthonoplastes TaxID=64178 RepID=UPI0032F45A5B
MKNYINNTFKLKKKWFNVLIITILVLGLFFRFVHLDQKVYWLDETHSSLRIFGYTEPEFIQDIFSGEVVNSDDLLKYQRPSPTKTWGDTIRVLAGNTEHAPLYYLALRVWSLGFGSSVAALRSFSVLISLFALPGIYWLCRELFESPFVAWVAVALMAISPFHILYAQEVRPYSLLTVAILLSSAALLRAIRLNKKTSWSIYAITLTLGFYTHWFFTVVAASHGLYVAVTQRFRFNKTVIAYSLASLAGVIAFSPWIINTITAPPPLEEQMGWVFQKLPLLTLVKSWGLSVSRVFVDLDRGWCLPLNSPDCSYLLSDNESLIYWLILPLIVLGGYSIYFICKNTPARVWVFIISLIAVMAAALIIPDLIKGGQRSTVTRYVIPCLLGFQLSVAYLFASKMSTNFQSVRQQKIWQVIFVTLISLGILSNLIITQAHGWWSKGGNYHVHPIATIVNQAEQPLILYSVPSNVLWGKGGAVGRVLPLTRQFEPNVGILFVVQPNVLPEIPAQFQDVFVYRPHDELKSWLEQNQNYTLEPVFVDPRRRENPRLWKLVK